MGTAIKKHEVDMTSGSIVKHVLMFTWPLLFGNLFQQLYNTVDTWVVGNYVGKVSFSAVGTIGPVINTLIGFFTGFSTGASVVISQYFGAKDKKRVRDSVHTFVGVTLILCVLFTILGVGLVPLFLRILQSPLDVAEEQRIYLVIYFAGFAGFLIYFMGSAILRSVGNSVFPFILLVLCTVSNIFLDLLFVLKFNMGTRGVALATIIAQGISAVVVSVKLLTIDSIVRIEPRKIRIDWKLTKKILGLGIPSAIQLSITSFGNIFVQSYVNFFGTDVMGGWTAYTKISNLVFLPLQSIALAVTTFVGQNKGAGELERERMGVNVSLGLSYASTILILLPVLIFTPEIVGVLVNKSETEVIRWGVYIVRLVTPFMVFACLNQILAGALRGDGKSNIPMYTMLLCFVVFRQIFLYVGTRLIENTPRLVSLSYPIAWILCAIILFVFYRKKFGKNA